MRDLLVLAPAGPGLGLLQALWVDQPVPAGASVLSSLQVNSCEVLFFLPVSLCAALNGGSEQLHALLAFMNR